MATVNVVVNGRSYGVGCEDGQEAHVEALARDFDRQVQDVGGQVGQVGDLRLFLMAALVTADELADAKMRLAQASAQLAVKRSEGPSEPPAPPATTASGPDPRAVAAIDAATSRIESLITKLG